MEKYDLYVFENEEELRENLSRFFLVPCYDLMSSLIDLYDDEGACNEGELSFEFLVQVYNCLMFIESKFHR